ncbi:MAG: hypothetical protein ACRCT9_09110, partial [Roseinatronobacter monicus]
MARLEGLGLFEPMWGRPNHWLNLMQEVALACSLFCLMVDVSWIICCDLPGVFRTPRCGARNTRGARS